MFSRLAIIFLVIISGFFMTRAILQFYVQSRVDRQLGFRYATSPVEGSKSAFFPTREFIVTRVSPRLPMRNAGLLEDDRVDLRGVPLLYHLLIFKTSGFQ